MTCSQRQRLQSPLHPCVRRLPARPGVRRAARPPALCAAPPRRWLMVPGRSFAPSSPPLQGVSRSATVVIAYLMWRTGSSYDDT